jgi:hypothetical protein
MPVTPAEAPIEELSSYEQGRYDLWSEHIDTELKKGNPRPSMGANGYVGEKVQRAIIRAYTAVGWKNVRFEREEKMTLSYGRKPVYTFVFSKE